jgi:hypothetical protein
MSVVAFPLSRETSTVRFIADSIARLQGEDAVTFWQATAGHLLSVAIERGNDAETARHEVRQFFDAVQASLRTSPRYAAE